MVNPRPPRVRRSAEVDEAILGTYLAGASSHRIRKALTPLLGEKHLAPPAAEVSEERTETVFSPRARYGAKELVGERAYGRSDPGAAVRAARAGPSPGLTTLR
jgi:hypothetical protein